MVYIFLAYENRNKMNKTAFSISKFIYTFFVIFLIWFTFTTSFQIAELVTGIVISLFIAYLTVKNFNCCDPILLTPSHLFYFIEYFFVFIAALIKANFDVARRVVSPSLPINPGIVTFETKLHNHFARMILANSITLTPGTLTIDVVDNRFYVHWIDVTTKNEQEVYNEIAAPFEKLLLKIYGTK